MIVIDASALVEFLVGGTSRAAQIAARIQLETLHAPHLIDLEVLSVLRGWEARQQLGSHAAQQAAYDMLVVPMTRYPHDLFVPRIWQLRGNLTSYDASYVALAENLRVPLLTCDARLAGAPGHLAKIELIN